MNDPKYYGYAGSGRPFDQIENLTGGFSQPATHELQYRAGSSGLASIGISDVSTPFWYCTCGQWMVKRDLQGRPFREAAERRHRKHIKETEGAPE